MKLLFQRLSGLMPYVFVFGLVLTTYLLLVEMSPSKAAWTYTDKIQHAMGFFLLASSASIGFPRKARFFYVGLVLYGALMEVLQGLLTVTRQASVYDWMADVAGILLSIILLNTLKVISNKETA
jgi:VanZ family protein